MKIGFTGTHGCGKSTLANLVSGILRENGWDAHLVNASPARIVMAREGIVAADMWSSLDNLYKYHSMIIDEKLKLESQFDDDEVVIFDRTYIDTIAYLDRMMGVLMYHAKRVDDEHPFDSSMIHKLINRAFELQSYFDVVFYVPPFQDEVVPDGVRPTTSAKAIDQEIERLVNCKLQNSHMNCHYISIPRSFKTLEQRTKFVEMTLHLLNNISVFP